MNVRYDAVDFETGSTQRRLVKSLLYSALWIAGGAALLLSAGYLVVYCNMFSWNPRLEMRTILAASGIVASLAFMFWLAVKTRGVPVLIVSFLVCMSLAIAGIYAFIGFHAEELTPGLLGRSTFSPAWFRITILAVFLCPMLVWLFYPFRVFRQTMGPADDSC